MKWQRMRRMGGTLVCLLGVTFAAEAQEGGPSQVAFEFLVDGSTRQIVIELDEARAPQTCANFKKLISSGFYEGQAVHRIIPNYLVQMGDPYTKEPGKKHLWGTGGPGYTVPAELGGKHNRGSVAMARLPDSQNSSRASNGSQFYIALDDLNQLDGQYTVFGKVIRGIDHLDNFSQRTADTNDVPANRIAIHGAAIGSQVDSEPTLAERAVKPVAAAAGGLKGVGSNLPKKLPLIPGREKRADSGAEASPDPAPVAVPAEPVSSPEAPVAEAAVSEVVASEPVDPAVADESKGKFSRLAKLAPSKLAVFGRKKAGEEAAASDVEEGEAIPVVEDESAEAKKRRFAIGGKGKKAKDEPQEVGSSSSTPPKKAEEKKLSRKKDEEEKEPGNEKKKGFFGKVLDRVW